MNLQWYFGVGLQVQSTPGRSTNLRSSRAQEKMNFFLRWRQKLILYIESMEHDTCVRQNFEVFRHSILMSQNTYILV